MKLSEVKSHLSDRSEVVFALPDGQFVPSHFYVTEVGIVTKEFIDCGGVVRSEKVCNFQLWSSTDTDHRLSAQKLLSIISLSEKTLGLGDLEVEVEYQSGTIGKYGIELNGDHFVLTNKFTDCLAKDNCGIPVEKTKVRLVDLTSAKGSSCEPGIGCC